MVKITTVVSFSESIEQVVSDCGLVIKNRYKAKGYITF